MTYPYQPGPPDPTRPPTDRPVQAYRPPSTSPSSYEPPAPYPPPAEYQQQPAYQPPASEFQAPPSYQAPTYQYPPPSGYPYGYPMPAPTEGLAIASLVVSCAAVIGMCGYGLGGIIGVVGAILGHLARGRIRRNGSQGAGMALAGIIVGWVMFAITVIIITGLIIAIANDST